LLPRRISAFKGFKLIYRNIELHINELGKICIHRYVVEACAIHSVIKQISIPYTVEIVRYGKRARDLL
jgi:hypothetical protein